MEVQQSQGMVQKNNVRKKIVGRYNFWRTTTDLTFTQVQKRKFINL